MCSNTWSPVCGTVCSRLDCEALLDEMCHWRQASCFPLCSLLAVCWRCESTVSAVMSALLLGYELYHSGIVNPIKCVPWWITSVIFIFFKNQKGKKIAKTRLRVKESARIQTILPFLLLGESLQIWKIYSWATGFLNASPSLCEVINTFLCSKKKKCN